MKWKNLLFIFLLASPLYPISQKTLEKALLSVNQSYKELRIYYHNREWIALLYHKKAPVYMDNYNKIKKLKVTFSNFKVTYEKNYKTYSLLVDLEAITAIMETPKEVFLYVK